MSSKFSDEYIEQEIGKITQQFKILQCAECAEGIKQWLKSNDIRGIKLRLKILGRGDFILSERWDGSQKSISQNGVNYGIEVRGKVFDNLSRFGISRKEWLEDFSCISGQFLIEEIEYF